MLQPLNHEQIVQLRNLIHQSFSLDEFRTFCFDVGVRYDDLPGESLQTRVTSLVLLCERIGRIDHLLAKCVATRPQINWLGLNEVISQAIKPIALKKPVRNPRQIFISHAHQDAAIAHQLADDLRQHKWDVWLAPESIPIGGNWMTAINRGLTESSFFVLVLTPDAVNSTFVNDETDAALILSKQGDLHFIILDTKPVTSPPPMWKASQAILLRNNYKVGFEKLLEKLQPDKMKRLATLYRQLEQALQSRNWSLAQELGQEINAVYPDYRETDARLTLARREAEREQTNQAEAARLYPRLETAVENADWNNALNLADQIDQLLLNYRDTAQLRGRARRGLRQQQNQQRQQRWHNLQGQLRRFSRWGLSGGVVVILLLACVGIAIALSQLINKDEDNTPTPSRTRPVIADVTIAPTTPAPTLTPTATATDTTQPTPSRTLTPTGTSTPTLDPGSPPPNPQLHSTWTRPMDGMVMVYVPGGTFLMGSDPDVDDDAQGDEQPQHEVTLTGFWIDRTEITNAQFAIFATETGYTTTAEIGGGGYNYMDSGWQYVAGTNWQQPQGPGSNINDLGDHPVVLMSWYDANAYCKWAGGQLPTEAQWEYAAQGEDGRLYPWGNTFDGTKANFCDADCTSGDRDAFVNDGYEQTAPVGSFTLAGGDSWVDAADMAGNVWEWVADWYEPYTAAAATDPEGPTSGDFKVLRGGSWDARSFLLRVAYRLDIQLTYSYSDDDFGFRCVVPPRN